MGLSSSFLSCFASVFIWLLFSVVIFAYERCLAPLYGTVPTNFHIMHIVLAVMTAATFTPIDIVRAISPHLSSPANHFIFAAPLLSAMPTLAYWTGVYTARLKDPWLGPVITHLIVLSPLGYLFAVSSLGLSLPVSAFNVVKRFTSCVVPQSLVHVLLAYNVIGRQVNLPICLVGFVKSQTRLSNFVGSLGAIGDLALLPSVLCCVWHSSIASDRSVFRSSDCKKITDMLPCMTTDFFRIFLVHFCCCSHNRCLDPLTN
jgi:hypothetical protein